MSRLKGSPEISLKVFREAFMENKNYGEFKELLQKEFPKKRMEEAIKELYATNKWRLTRKNLSRVIKLQMFFIGLHILFCNLKSIFLGKK